MRMYEKFSNGLTSRISLDEGQWILRHYSGKGACFVQSMTQPSPGVHVIVLKRGERIRLVEIDANPEPSEG
ncbi:hypothetical protein [Streptomyces chartreusis]